MTNTKRREFPGRTAMAGASLAFSDVLRAGQETAAVGGWQPKPVLSSVMFSLLPIKAFRALAQKPGFFYAWQSAEGTKQLPGHGPADFRPWLKAPRHGLPALDDSPSNSP